LAELRKWLRPGRSDGLSAFRLENQFQTELQLAHIDAGTKAADGAEIPVPGIATPAALTALLVSDALGPPKFGWLGKIESFKTKLGVTALGKVKVAARNLRLALFGGGGVYLLDLLARAVALVIGHEEQLVSAVE
jgi:hypothetical protein